eukprot:TRINITY_DN22204_c0_g1_i1.p1 TRINITY_DN22204_c0_g1~~TRINITY_DN22204_c0_g1_i1.p1  ORF type:complete len:455 (-),score=66.39 TRINITY_DN22204_c0_g1_i1:25-1287(-)
MVLDSESPSRDIAADWHALDEAVPEDDGPKASMFSCVTALGFSGIGAGILSLPWAVSTFGLVGGVAVLCGTGVLANVSLCVLLDAQKACQGSVNTLPEVVAAFVPRAKPVVNAVIFIDCLGALVVYVDFCADAVRSTARDAGVPVAYLSPALLKLVICFLVVVPLSLPRAVTRAAALAPLSLVALGYVCSLIVCQALFDSSGIVGEKGAVVSERAIELFVFDYRSLKGLCVILFAFINQVNLFGITKDLSNPTMGRKRLVVLLATLFMMVVYSVCSVCGYIAFGNDVHEDILTSFPRERSDVLIANVALAGMLILCAVLLLYPIRGVVLSLCDTQGRSQADAPAWLWISTTMLIASCVALLTIAVPCVVTALDFVGGFCAPCLIFVFPLLTLRFTDAPMKASVLLGAALVGFFALTQTAH